MEITPDGLAYLRVYTPQTYGMNLPREISTELLAAGLVEWLPPTAWSGAIYGLTEAGKAFVEGLPAPPDA